MGSSSGSYDAYTKWEGWGSKELSGTDTLRSLIQGPPKRDKPAAPPEEPDVAATERRARERIRAQAAGGRESTTLTGPSGLSGTATTAPKTLMGS